MGEEALRDVEAERLPFRGLRFGPRDEAEARHLAEHLVAALACGGRVEDRVVVARSLRQPREQGGAAQVELPDRPREEDLRGGLDAHRGASLDRPVGGDVQVLAEDFALGVACRVLFGQFSLDDLAFDALVGVGNAEVADQLLGDRRAALDRFAGGQVLEESADDRIGIDPAVLVEALVLDRDRRQLQVLRYPPQGDRGPRFVGGDDAELAAVGGEDRRVAALVDRFARGEWRRLCGHVEHPAGDADRERRERREQGAADQDQLAREAAATSLAPAAALAHACVSPVERLWMMPSTSSWFGITTELPSPGST